MKRRDFLRMTGLAMAAVTSGGALSTGSLAGANRSVRVALSWLSNVEYAGIWLAYENGYFEDEGLAVEHQPGGPNAPKPLVMLAAGETDIGYGGWLPFVDAVSRGNDFVLVATTFPVSPLGILSMPKAPILKAEDIVGKRILAQGAKEKTAVEATLRLNGLPNDWEFVPAGFSPEPLLAGAGDGYTAFGTNQAVALELRGLVRGEDFHFVSFDELGLRSYASVIFTSRQWLDRDRPTIVQFLRALTRGWQDNAKDPAVAAKLAVGKYGVDLGLDLKQQVRQNEVQIAMMQSSDRPLLSIDRATIAGPMYDAARATGRENLPDPELIADVSVMKEVHTTLS